MQHCTHLHSIFYPACLVECYTYSIYRSKNRKGQISRKDKCVGFFFFSKGSNVFTSVTLNWLPVRLEVTSYHWEPVWVRNRDFLGSEKAKVHSLQFEWLFSSSSFTPLFLMHTYNLHFAWFSSYAVLVQRHWLSVSLRRESGVFQM